MAKLKILIVASEMAPYAKTGGLADVIGSLPRSFTKRGHEVLVVIPAYASVMERFSGNRLSLKESILVNGIDQSITLLTLKSKPAQPGICFVANDYFFERSELYRDSETGKDYVDNDERFSFFARASLMAARAMDFRPDIVHLHDWQSGLIAVYLKNSPSDGFFTKSKIVLTIHNLAYQGTFKGNREKTLDLPKELFYATGALEFYGKVNFLKGAIVFADKITTVSPTYAEEIQSTAELGCGLEGVLKKRSHDITGILNGVDYSIWSPSRDKFLTKKYRPSNLSGKKANKTELLNEANLPQRATVPLVGMVTRLADQKGLDLIEKAAEQLFSRDLQIVILGTGDAHYHDLLSRLERMYPDKLKVWLKFDERRAHLIEAGADMFLMPSRYEPCGLNQMYSLKYGTVPIVRAVGGLVDSVDDFNESDLSGTGFVFRQYSAKAMITAVDRALGIYQKRRMWTRLMKSGMQKDFSWDAAAEKYEQLFFNLCRR